MKKVLFVLMALCFVSSLAFAAEPALTTAAKDSTTTAVLTTNPTTTAVTTTTKDVTTTTTATMTTEAAVTAPVTTPVAAPVVVTPEAIVLKGDVIDNMCAGANKDKLAEFVKMHTKQCALMPGCIESGYSIFADGKLYAFDKDSSTKVAEFLKQADSKLQVTVTAKQVGDELSLVSIENQN